MPVMEGRGYLLRSGTDAPFAGWVSAKALGAFAPIEAAPWMALRSLSELARLLPGGLSLLWDLPLSALSRMPPEACAAFWGVVGHLPGLSLHVREQAFVEHLEGPIHGWIHEAQPPRGPMGQAWRQGWIGWVPEPGPEWSLPGVGRAEGSMEAPEEPLSGWQWGEVVLPLGALKDLGADDLVPLLADTQARLERNLSLRMSAHAWPAAFPFLRRRTGWRISLVGGREYISANGTWAEAAVRLGGLLGDLSLRLKCPIQLGSCHDSELASLLGHQAMREGHPWRYSLPIPPASPTFTPGLAADPRDAAPLEFRVAFPEDLAALLSHPPVAFLRLPHVPQEASVAAFLRGLGRVPAIRWIPGELPPPGPFLQERPWAPASAFLPLTDVTQALQPSLFDEIDPADAE